MNNLPPLIFDIHLDLAMNAMEWNRDLRLPLERVRWREWGMTDKPDRANGTVSLPEMRRGRVGLCVATQIARHISPFSRLPGWNSPEQAWAHTQGQLAWYRAMETCGELAPIRTAAELETHLARWSDPAQDTARLPIGYVLSLEGADSILSWKHLERAFADGLRAIGPAHYGPGTFAHGTNDSGPLPPKGRELLREMQRLGIILDATHLCDESFWDALRHFSGPVWASHSNCRALADWNRQFADDQIRALIERDAVIGMAFDAIMMVTGWTHLRSKPQDFNLRLERICDHIDHICQLAGNARHVAIGTDLDGGYGNEQTALDLRSIADLQHLTALLERRGFSPADSAGIFHRNAIDFLRRAWH
jgi:membrane dipeptidase